MNKILLLVLVVLLLVTGYLVFDNAGLTEINKAATDLIKEYEISQKKYLSVTDCIDNIEQYELNDGTVVVEAQDIKDCVIKVQSESLTN